MHNTKYSMYDYCFLKACEWNSEYYEYYVIALLIHVSLQSRNFDLLLKILTLEAFVLIHIYFGLFTTRLLDVSTMNHSIILIINNQEMPFLLKSLFFPVGIVYIFFKIIIFLIWHPCVVYNRNKSPERGVSPEGDTPLEGELFLLYTTQGCHICFIIPNNIQNTKGGKLTNTRDFG